METDLEELKQILENISVSVQELTKSFDELLKFKICEYYCQRHPYPRHVRRCSMEKDEQN